MGQVSWDIRNAVPLTEPGHIRWLDAVEREVLDGHGGPDLASQLHTAGVQYVLVRNDLAYGWAGSTRPSMVRAALSTTPGMRVVASFGPRPAAAAPPSSSSTAG